MLQHLFLGKRLLGCFMEMGQTTWTHIVCCAGVAVPAADARALWPSHRVRPAVVPGITQSPAGQDGPTRDTGPHHAPQHTGRAYDAWGAPARGDQGALGL